MEQAKNDQMSEFNVYVKEYFQDWLDINAINQFKTRVT